MEKYETQLLMLEAGNNSYEEFDPETVIFYKKKVLAKSLLEIPIEDLQTAQKQPWYGEYIALLAIRLENPALQLMAKKYFEELMEHYNEKITEPVRELAVLGMIQFTDPLELRIPFNQYLLNKTMIADIRAVFMNYCPSVNYGDNEISTYYLSRQAQWRHEKRKIRVVFMVHSQITYDKVLPIYEAMKERDDITPILIIFPGEKYDHGVGSWQYFHDRYPNDKIYDTCTLMDLQKLRPDYVFTTSPYEHRRPFPGFRINDLIKFTKVCVIAYGASLAYTFVYRLFDDYVHFWRNIYLLFASTDTVKTVMTEKFPKNINMNLQHTEFLGYPALKTYYQMPIDPSDKKRILWTPRWIPNEKYESRIGGSYFLPYKDNFVALRERYGEKVELFFRPHMNLFRGLIKQKIMTREEVIAYRRNLKKANIIRHATLADMDSSIRNIDIFLSDYSTILLPFFLTCRPIIYCEFSAAVPFPEYKEMFEAMYIAHSWEDVEHYLDKLIADNDPLLEKRREIAKRIYEEHKDATEKIVERIVQDFNQNCMTLSPVEK